MQGYHHRPPPLRSDTIALAAIPRASLVPAPPPAHKHARTLPAPTHLARLSLWQCPLLVPRSRLSWQGARYVPGPGVRAIISSIMSQTSRGAWEHRRQRDVERENERERGKLCSHFLSFIYSGSFSPSVPWKPLVPSITLSVSIELDSRWRDCKQSW